MILKESGILMDSLLWTCSVRITRGVAVSPAYPYLIYNTIVHSVFKSDHKVMRINNLIIYYCRPTNVMWS